MPDISLKSDIPNPSTESTDGAPGACGPKPQPWLTFSEVAGVLGLLAMAAYFLATSWRKWPDPIADSGLQWYAFWRLSEGARLYHDVIWNYGPVSAWFNAGLFKHFGPGMMVLVTANLVIYGLIVTLAYLAFRKAWGRLGAFAALGVFISVFSFSQLNAVANYNFVTPYAHEATHGILLLLITAFIAVRWCQVASRPLALLLGLCGGLAAVLKPEFMLAGGVVGILAMFMRRLFKQHITVDEWVLLVAGLVLPTAAFTLRFAHDESIAAAFADASRAWWNVLVDHSQTGTAQQQTFLGFDQPWHYGWLELSTGMRALVAIGAVLAAGWLFNRRMALILKLVTAAAAIALALCVRIENGWFWVGLGFPVLLAVALAVLLTRAAAEFRQTGFVNERLLMAVTLTLLAVAMLARMPLRARVYHLGFYQAALAGMVIAAFLVKDVPRWAGSRVPGRALASLGLLVMLGIGCAAIAVTSHNIRADQTLAVGAGPDRFYASVPEVQPAGALVEWAVARLQTAPPHATVCVLPEGYMINYLSRRVNPVSGRITDEPRLLEELQRTKPNYVIILTRDVSEYGSKRFATPGGPGQNILKWLRANYGMAGGAGADPLAPGNLEGIMLLTRNAKPPAPADPAATTSK